MDGDEDVVRRVVVAGDGDMMAVDEVPL